MAECATPESDGRRLSAAGWSQLYWGDCREFSGFASMNVTTDMAVKVASGIASTAARPSYPAVKSSSSAMP